MWYESDFYTKVGWTMFEDFSAALIYTAYMSPNDFFKTVQELAVSFAFNDSKYTGKLRGFALNPTLLVAFEVKGQADAGAHRGVYMQLGLTPSYTFNAKGTYPITVSTPLLARSQRRASTTSSARAITPRTAISRVASASPCRWRSFPSSLGNWQFKAGVNFLRVNGNLRDVNNGDRKKVNGTATSRSPMTIEDLR